jgi:integrase
VDPFCIQDAETPIAAIHRDWGEAQGNYDEFRFFTGLRPSEQIALVLTDIDIENGVISINKARVFGVDRCRTKTGPLCKHLVAAGKIHHDHVFVQTSGEPMQDLQVATIRWRKTLRSLKVRYRPPYTLVILR